jgi:phosphoribosyl-ATP pyrophosphohydrolase/phosphoribosyl-AMP cyclohydrolase
MEYPNFTELKFDERGLIPALVQDARTGEALMLAYMNRESLGITIKEGRTCFFSRERGKLWRKGETSGHVQRVVRITADCDSDALLVEAVPEGPACHTNKRSCFHNPLYAAEGAGNEIFALDGAEDTDGVLAALYALIQRRKAEHPEGSYTTYLFDKGIEKILKKVGEEASEVIIAAMKGSKEETVYEAADLCYHMLVLLCEAGISPSEVAQELARRRKDER